MAVSPRRMLDAIALASFDEVAHFMWPLSLPTFRQIISFAYILLPEFADDGQ